MSTDSPTHSEIAHATVQTVVGQVCGGLLQGEVFGLHGSGAAHLTAGLLEKESRTLLVIAADGGTAERFASDLAFYHGRSDDIFLFPHWEMRPYEPLTPHPE